MPEGLQEAILSSTAKPFQEVEGNTWLPRGG